jgi:hypothetical protein
VGAAPRGRRQRAAGMTALFFPFEVSNYSIMRRRYD